MSNLKFRKRPVVIEAIQWTGSNLREVITFMDGEPYTKSHYASDAWDLYCRLVAKEGLKINTLEGMMNANVGDWIIKGVKGEHYPCKPDVFAMTYEADAPPAAAHGDEEVRALKADLDAAQEFCRINAQSGMRYAEQRDQAIEQLESAEVLFRLVVDWFGPTGLPHGLREIDEFLAMRAQAGEGGEV